MTLYYMQKCKKKPEYKGQGFANEFYSTIHVGTDKTTLCGKTVNEMWYLQGAIEDEHMIVTCKKCAEMLKNAHQI